MKLERKACIHNLEIHHDSIDRVIFNCFFDLPTDLEEQTLIKMNRKTVKIILEMTESILDDAERKYLSGVISPFREKVINISKRNFHDNYFILISVNGKSKGSFSNHTLPIFDEQDSYIGMELNKEYTPEELGL